MLDLDPASVLFVGDDLRDIESAATPAPVRRRCATAISTRTTTRNHWGADVVVDHPLELRKVLDSALCSCCRH
jgi:phosphoglycolate phosphatase